MNFKKSSVVVTFILVISAINAQTNYNQISGKVNQNTITTAVPFLMISPDSRAGGIGDQGVASSPDVYSIHWNPSKLAFVEKQIGVGVSYIPWLRAIVPDMNLGYLSGYYKVKDIGTFGGSLRYFSLGEIIFTDINGNEIGQFQPNEFAMDIAYARKFSETFSMGGAVRFVNSNLTKGTFVNGAATRAGRAVAVDISATYRNEEISLGDKKAIVTGGIDISNVGNRISYSTNNSTLSTSSFLPINMRLGGGLTIKMDDHNAISFIAEANKLLVPTPPVYERDASGNLVADGNGGYKIAEGKDPNRGVASGIFGSFSDAPGGGQEELREINCIGGLEYIYDNLFVIRTGYFYEHPSKGNRKYVSLGAGINYNIIGLDFSYLIPTSATANNPLQNTLRISISFNFDQSKGTADASAPANN